MKIQRKIDFRKVFAIGMLVFISIMIVASYISRGTYLTNMLFLNQGDYFMDFFNSIQWGLSPYKNNVIYPPLMNVIYAFWGHFISRELRTAGNVAMRDSNIGLMVFLIYNLIQIYFFSYLMKSILKLSNREKFIYTAVILGAQPMLFCLQRGNSVLLSVIGLLFFTYFYKSDNKLYSNLAYVMLGITAGIKIYPAIYGLLYLRDRKWKETFKCIICGMLLFFVPFLAFPGGLINVKVMIENIINCSNDFGTYRYGWKHNFNNFYNILNFITDVDFKKIYIVMCIFIVLIAIIIVMTCRKIDQWKIYALLSALIILIPSFSYSYNLTFMIVPLTFFLSKDNKSNTKLNYIYSLLFVLMFAPIVQSTNDIANNSLSSDCYPLTLGTLIQNIVLLLMVILICVEGSIELCKLFRNKGKKCEKKK